MLQMSYRSAIAAVLLTVAATAARAADSVPDDPRQIRPLAVGTTAPAFVVHREDGSDYAFNAARLSQPTVLIFYRGGWCPYCNANLADLRNAEKELNQRGFDVLFLSADKPELLRSSLKEPHPGYTLLSDAKMNAARAMGIAFRVDDDTYEKYKGYGIDLEQASGAKHHELPVPAVFIIDRSGIIRFVYANADYKVRLKADELLAASRDAGRQ